MHSKDKKELEKKREKDTVTLRILIFVVILIGSGTFFNYVMKNGEIFVLLIGASLGLLLGEYGISYWDRREGRIRHDLLMKEFLKVEEQQKIEHTINHLTKFKDTVELSHTLNFLMSDLLTNDEFHARLMMMKSLSNAQALGISQVLDKELQYWKVPSSSEREETIEQIKTSKSIIEECIRGISEELAIVFEIGWLSSLLVQVYDPNQESKLESNVQIIKRTKDWLDQFERLSKLMNGEYFEPHLIQNLIKATGTRIEDVPKTKLYYFILISDWYIRRFWTKNELISKLKELMRTDLEKDDFPQKASEIIMNLEIQFPLDMPVYHIQNNPHELLERARNAGNL